MGVVYLGEHRRIARRAAIKVLRPDLSDNAEIVTRFFTEARATSMIRHPGIVEVLDCDLLPDGNAYIVMEYLEGETLAAAIAREGRLPVARALSLARHVADALAAAHERGIVHRDLKPDNLFLPSAGGGAPAAPIKILDFGIAKLTMLEPGGHHKTRTGRLLGTPTYMSPEQCRGAKDIDHRTDVYSLGCILFEMLCGRPPFDEQGFGQLVYSHLSVTPPPARSLERSVPPTVDRLLARMLAKTADQRPQSLRQVIGDIDRIVATPWVTEPYRSVGSGAAVEPKPTPASPPAAAKRSPAERSPAERSSAERSPAERPVASSHGGTTLGAAASERMPAVLDDPAHGRRMLNGPVVALATAAVVVGGALTWRQLSTRTEVAAARESATRAASATAVGPPAPVAPEAPVAPAAPAPATAAPSAPPVAAASAASARAAEAPAESRRAKPTRWSGGSETVTVSIASDPRGADVCLAGLRRLMGKTRFDWTTERNTLPVRLLVRKQGYRGEEISVVPNSNGKRHVRLKRLGSDEVEDAEKCE